MDRIVSHYRVLQKIGSGGMGEVCLAEDLQLGRKVALKFLSGTLMTMKEHFGRLEREARAASALNHPNILIIYEIGRSDPDFFIASEYVEGETLRQRLVRGPIVMEEALDLILQVLAALQAAHVAGIMHRDIKPENIMVRPDGFVKVLDFGLAKQMNALDSTEDAATVLQTMPGVLIGTIPYMSPEQARGLDLDSRTDLFSVGVVLFEMITGRRPFEGATPTDILARIIQNEPVREQIPDAIYPIIQRALSKAVDARYQSAKDMIADLRELKLRLELESIRAGVVSLPRLIQVTFADAVEEYPEWSPDGSRLVFSKEISGLRKLFLKDIATGDETQLTNSDFDEIQPSWSPDGCSLAFVRAQQRHVKLQPGDVFGVFVSGNIWTIDLESGKQTQIISKGFNPAYSPDGNQIAFDASFAGPRRIWVADANGLNPLQVTSDTSEELDHVFPRWSPDGSRIVFQNIERTKFDIRIVHLPTREMHWLTNDLIQDLHPVWSPSGRFIYFTSYRSGGLNLWRIPVSVDGRAQGQPQQLTAGAGQDISCAISRNGKRLAFSILKQNADIWKFPVRKDTGEIAGSPEPVISTTREDSRGAWSPDASHIAFNSDRTGDMNIWLYSLKNRSSKQLTRGPGGDYQPNWSPDSLWISFFSSRSGTPNIWAVECGSGMLRQLTDHESININPFYSPDGKMIAYQSDQSGRTEIWLMNADGTEQRPLTQIGVRGHFMRWDGDSIVFFSPHQDQPGLYRIRIGAQEPEFVAQIQGGAHLSFSPDRSLIMDVVGHKTIWVSPIVSGQPRKVFEFEDTSVRIDYPLWSPDGEWVLFDRFKPLGGNIWMMENFE